MIFLKDNDVRENLFPFTLTRHVADIPIGILTIREKWELLLNETVSIQPINNALEIPANIIPTKDNYEAIISLVSQGKMVKESDNIKVLKYPWHIFQLCGYGIKNDFTNIIASKISQKISTTNILINASQIFIEEGAYVEHAVLNATNGPIVIAKNAVVQEGSMIRGACYVGENTVVKMGAKIFEEVSIGNHCVVGGEVKNSVLFNYSNKAHDGYLGSSVIGAWCNLGAGTSNSNIKNTASNVQVQINDNLKIDAGLKAGLFMGDYSRAAINTSFNTGTVVGVCCNIFGEQNLPKFIDNFTWGKDLYDFEKAITHIQNWMALKDITISKKEIDILAQLYSQKK